MKHVLVLDVGTTNMKLAIVNEQGKVVSQETKKINMYRNEEGAAEHNPKELWSDFLELSQKTVANFKDEIVLLVLSGYQFGFLPIDKNYQPLTGMITLLDTRSQSIMIDFEKKFSTEKIYQKTGCPPAFNYTLQRILWLKKEKPDIFKNINKIIDIKSFFIYQLTGQCISEPSVASTTQLLDIRTQDWDEELVEQAGIKREQLPRLLPGNAIADVIKREVANKMGLKKQIPVMLGVYDGGAMILGMGGFEDNAVCNLGTTAMFRCAYSEPLLDKSGSYRLQTYALLPHLWATGAAVNNAGIVIDWFINNIAKGMSYEDLNKEAMKVSVGSNGLICFPFLTGERDPRIGSLATGSFFGLKTTHSISHMARSIFEGIGYSLNLLKTALEENNVHLKYLTVGGSGSKSEVWPQILADIFNMPVTKSLTENATLIGEAMLAFTEIGLFKNLKEAGKIFIKKGDSYQPNPVNVKKYESFYEFFSEMITCYHDKYIKYSIISKD
ncbi:gluconokinase [Petrotoga sp. 9PWA.NaAc.5.4]|uniref:gluconokinase n=1 Tax=Petrotoga sp. 9PWA.NaAc.5.4 TaxID=1434328 RepID=UPI000CB021B6|nr:gluconokinase [Petrotoga sp. 9PWA.NaAc.5.4]PNR95319.1 sugar (pentulose and hexulose) kinase [Petrotoga sp. 9PWA.NaAc.5.4]